MDGKKNKDDLAVFCKLFHEYHAKLHRYAYTILKDDEAARDVVQNTFLTLWEKRGRILFDKRVGNYLYKSIYTRCLNVLRDNKTRLRHTIELTRNTDLVTHNAKDRVAVNELAGRIEQIFERLPPQCKCVFTKSRKEGMRYDEIAKQLNISVKTVETQIGKALKIFREALSDFL